MKLTNAIKQQIVDNALTKAGIPAREEALRARRAAWAEKVRIEACGGEEAEAKLVELRDHFAELAKCVPDALMCNVEFIQTDTDIVVNVSGLRVRVWWCGALKYDDAIRPIKRRISPPHHTLFADNQLTAEFHDLHNEQEAIKADRDTLTANVRGALSNITTDKRLLEAWPEASELLPKQVAISRSNLPAVRVDELNAMIGLPTEGATK